MDEESKELLREIRDLLLWQATADFRMRPDLAASPDEVETAEGPSGPIEVLRSDVQARVTLERFAEFRRLAAKAVTAA